MESASNSLKLGSRSAWAAQATARGSTIWLASGRRLKPSARSAMAWLVLATVNPRHGRSLLTQQGRGHRCLGMRGQRNALFPAVFGHRGNVVGEHRSLKQGDRQQHIPVPDVPPPAGEVREQQGCTPVRGTP